MCYLGASMTQLSCNTASSYTLKQELMDIYGPLIELNKLSQLLDRNRRGIKAAVINASKNPDHEHPFWVSVLAKNMFRVGNKIHFRTHAVAEIFIHGSPV